MRRRKLPRVIEDADPYAVGADSISARVLFVPHTATGDQCSPLHIKISQESDSLTCIFCGENVLFVACARELPYNGSRSREGRKREENRS